MHDEATQSADAALAQALALMTLWAAPCPHCAAEHGLERVRAALAARITRQLQMLAQAPDLGPAALSAAEQLQSHWQALAAAPTMPTSESALTGPARSAVLH